MTPENIFKDVRLELGIDLLSMANLLNLGKNGEHDLALWEEDETLASQLRRRQAGELIDHVAKIKRDAPLKGALEGKFTFIDLFAGIGGMRLGFQSQGGVCVFTSEWDKFAQKTYLANYGEVAHGDIRSIKAKDIPEHDVLLAGFPCQAFSQAGLQKGFYDTRGTLFFEVQRVLVEKRPKAFLLENVKQLKGHDKGRTLNTILSILQGEAPSLPDDIVLSDETKSALSVPLNYDVRMKVLSSRDYGLPQHRERVFIVGFDKDQVSEASREKFKFPQPSGIKTALSDILEDITDAERAKLTLSDKLWQGHQLRRKKHAQKGNGFGCNVFQPDAPYTVTISARYYKDGAEILIDQSHLNMNPRKLSTREALSLQGFSSAFVSSAVSDVQMYKQSGNAVSVNVIQAIASEMMKVLEC